MISSNFLMISWELLRYYEVCWDVMENGMISQEMREAEISMKIQITYLIDGHTRLNHLFVNFHRLDDVSIMISYWDIMLRCHTEISCICIMLSPYKFFVASLRAVAIQRQTKYLCQDAIMHSIFIAILAQLLLHIRLCRSKRVIAASCKIITKKDTFLLYICRTWTSHKIMSRHHITIFDDLQRCKLTLS